MNEDAHQPVLAPTRASAPDADSDSEPDTSGDVICFSHLRWDFVFQRPQHLMTQCARSARVFYIEEPVFDAAEHPGIRVVRKHPRLHVVTPVLPHGTEATQTLVLRELIDRVRAMNGIGDFTAWYYTPLALGFSDHLAPACVVYDCMDELGNFKDAPQDMARAEQALLDRADVVFTGGHSLFQAKRDRHANVHAFPSSIDRAHFARARLELAQPADQRDIPRPRLGFFGVIDERFDIDLVHDVALQRPDWQIVLVGPVVKIDPALLPRLPNIHYLGMKSYAELPGYLSGWNVAIMPFARNASTQFISPTKTPEYLAGGIPVVSTSINDVVHTYGHSGLVKIADTPDDFVAACESLMAGRAPGWLATVDAALAGQSWERTWQAMAAQIDGVGASRAPPSLPQRPVAASVAV